VLGILALLAVVPAATVTGTVSATTIPPSIAASLTHDRHVCGQLGPVWSSTVSADAQKRIAGAIVYLEPRGPTSVKAIQGGGPGRALVIDQKNCQFVPRVAAVRAGSEVRVRSSDPVFHNVHIRDLDGATLANISTPFAGTEVAAFVPKKTGPLFLGCDAGHQWMKAEILVLDHGFHTRTERGGTYRLDKVPAGAWWLIAWHPQLGEVRMEIDVRPTDRQLSVQFAFR